jgi:predicted ATPase
MINEITLFGFKSFLNRKLKLNQLTVLTGLNSSGKSSIIQALLILEKAMRNENSILLDGHGSVEEIRNTFHNKEIQLSVMNEFRKEFITTILLSNVEGKTYNIVNREDFDFPEIIYISANRFGPKTSVPIYNDSSKRNRIGVNGENLFQFIKSFEDRTIDPRLIHPESEGETLEYNIRGWLSVISPNVKFRYEIEKNSDTSYSMFNEHRATNVGFGLSYSLSVIASLLIGTLIPNSLVIIENPEAHLHPKGQTEIAKLISLCSIVGTQVIIETHSDHLFDGIRISAKENKGFAKSVQIHWFELDDKQNTEVYSPILDDDGRLDEWPKGLFDQFEINASKLI